MRVGALALVFAILSVVPGMLAKHGEGGDDDDGAAPATSTPPASSTPPATSATSAPPATSSPTATSTPPATSTAAAATSSTAPSPTPTPFQFLPPSNATTCQNVMLKWQSNISTPITLSVTNGRVINPPASSSENSVLVSRTLSTNVSASAGQFMWASVDVPPGPYVAVAFDTSQNTGIFAQSLPFFVQMGQDSSCLASASATSAPPPPGSPTSTSDSEASSGSSDSSAGSQPKKLGAGVLAGVVVAVVVGVLLLILAATFPHYWKDAFIRRRQNQHPGGPYHLF
ncbi:hypothetical protein BD311DRAFT_721162 [Dichomitus squalens]|uniref:Ser-Thr-rich glycosyl-phosphatidyl-inositol-anchored membrane family-domain-containing protein n=1 Tax=Dichomitus squalens TaxID=114155 RepID=A0A4Q9MN09_9APHY|nr:hypothetical protein BD311DRAFT_721162 [Dichomitus squalens]